jgi:hypothetical protein
MAPRRSSTCTSADARLAAAMQSGRVAGPRGGALARVLGLAVLTLAPACGSGGPGKPEPGKDAGTDAGDAAVSRWETVVHPLHDMYLSIWLGAPGTIYAVAQNDPSYDNGTSYSIASSHDDGATWTMVPLTDSTQPILSVIATGATDVYGFGFSNGPTLAPASPPLIAKSTDSGATFTLLHPTFSGSLYVGGTDGAGNPIAAGGAPDGGFFVRSTDGGGTWTRARVPGTSALNALWTSASGTIYACGIPATASPPPDGGIDVSRPDGGADAGDAGPAPGGVVVRSDDNGNSWTTLTTTPSALFAISGVPDLGALRIIAVGAGYTQAQSDDSGATWSVFNGLYGGSYGSHTFSNFTGVWIPPGTTAAPFIAAVGAPYVVTGLVSTGGDLFAGGFYEDLPAAGLGLQSSARALAATADAKELWAVGAGIFRRR